MANESQQRTEPGERSAAQLDRSPPGKTRSHPQGGLTPPAIRASGPSESGVAGRSGWVLVDGVSNGGAPPWASVTKCHPRGRVYALYMENGPSGDVPSDETPEQQRLRERDEAEERRLRDREIAEQRRLQDREEAEKRRRQKRDAAD